MPCPQEEGKRNDRSCIKSITNKTEEGLEEEASDLRNEHNPEINSISIHKGASKRGSLIIESRIWEAKNP